MRKISATLVDVCLPCYLTDSYSREGQTLALSPTGLTVMDTVNAAFDSIDCDAGIPSSVTDSEIRTAIRNAVNHADRGPVIGDDDGGDEPYVYVALEW